MQTNEQVFREYINEQSLESVGVEWCKWMLKELESANKTGVAINPAWLRASSNAFQPEMIPPLPKLTQKWEPGDASMAGAPCDPS